MKQSFDNVFAKFTKSESGNYAISYKILTFAGEPGKQNATLFRVCSLPSAVTPAADDVTRPSSPAIIHASHEEFPFPIQLLISLTSLLKYINIAGGNPVPNSFPMVI